MVLLFADGAIPEHCWSEHDQQEPAPRGVHSEEGGLADEGRGKGAAAQNIGRRPRRRCQSENVDLIESVSLDSYISKLSPLVCKVHGVSTVRWPQVASSMRIRAVIIPVLDPNPDSELGCFLTFFNSNSNSESSCCIVLDPNPDPNLDSELRRFFDIL